MKTTKTNWINHPSKKQLILLTTIWILGVVLLVISMTNLFKESIFQVKYVLIYFLLIGSTVAIVRLYRNYYKNA